MGGGEVGVLSKEDAGVVEGDLAQPCTIFLAACRCSQSQLERRGCCSVYACVTVFCVYMQLQRVNSRYCVCVCIQLKRECRCGPK